MTREEAIETLKANYPDACYEQLREAVDTAIHALRTDGDTISRQDAIDALKMDISIIPFAKAREYVRAAIDTIYNRLEELSSAQQWIPVTERLPEDLQEVNITWVNHNPEPYYDFVKDKHCSGSAVYYKGSWYWYSSTCVDILTEYGRNEMDKIDDGIEVVAWMPLPSPYKEGGEA